MPKEFVPFFENDPSIGVKIETVPDSFLGRCSLELKIVLYYSSAEDLAKQMADYYSCSETLTIKEINGIKWHYFYDDGMITSDYYLTEKDSKVYMFQYSIGKEADKNICEPYRTSIINSVSYK